MGVLFRYLRILRSGSRGQTMTEYALILAAIAVICFGVYQTLGTETGNFVQLVVDLFP